MKKLLILAVVIVLSASSFAAPKTGKINNIVIFISFPDSPMTDSAFRSYYERFYDGDSNSLKDYINETSYGKLEIVNHFYPKNVFCYHDNHSMNDYITADPEWNLRESTLFKNALKFIQETNPIDSTVIFDANGDDCVDNIIFLLNGYKENAVTDFRIVFGARYDKDFSIYGKTIEKYFCLRLIPETKKTIRIMAMESFYFMSIPFLSFLPLSSQENTSIMGEWDIMSKGLVHPCAYAKYKHFGWIDSIPEITKPGKYTLHALLSDTNNCYQIKSPVSEHEFFILEYRKAVQGTYEEDLPGSGLTITCINDLFTGNMSDKGNEMYIYRPTIETDSIPNWKFAAFTDKENRTSFNSTTTNPLCLLSDGRKGGISISNVKENADGTLSFTFDGFDVTPFIKCKDTLFFNSVSNFRNHLSIEETNLDSWYTSQSVNWIQSTSDFDKRIITFKTLSANNTGVDRIAEANIFLHNNILKTITLIQNPVPTATYLSHEMQEFSIYPNPVSNGELRIESGELINSIEIFNLFGQKVFSQIVNQNNVTISANHLSNGMYVVQCKFADGSMNNAKVIIN